MPNHLHLLIEALCGERARTELTTEMAALTKSRFPGSSIWNPAPEAERIPDLHHLRRQIRYVHLNPTRAALARDPLEWEWSTHRDAVGACALPWLDTGFLARHWRVFPRDFHSYVSGDPSVRIQGTLLPPTLDPRQLATSWEQLEWAISSVLRSANQRAVRRLLVRFAARLNSFRRGWIAERAGIADRTLREILSSPPRPHDEEAMKAALLLLSAPARFRPTPPEGGGKW